MNDNVKEFQRVDALAREILTLSRNTLLVNLRFLDMALSQFEFVSYPGTLATDGAHLFYDTFYVLASYKAERGRVVRDYLHIVLHCVFRHLFTGPDVDRRRWDLACDIAVESAVNDLALPGGECRRQALQQETLRELRETVHPMTAEKLYRYFADQNLTDEEIARLREPFLGDDHRAWYLPVQGGGAPGEGKESSQSGHTAVRTQRGKNSRGRSMQSRGDAAPGSQGKPRELEQTWKDISERMKVDLETMPVLYGSRTKGLMQELQAVTREEYDYGDFLRRFTTLGEVVQVNDEEFDYIFYTYGLRLYGKMPLVEPLEYKEVKRVREFVIAIDTSGSVSGELVRKFVSRTYDILKQQENFFTKINLHIVQCDAQIKEDRKITGPEAFEEYLKTMELRGAGGTDFRPVFRYVDELIRGGEFTNLKGLIYFTDGLGAFPEQPPAYDTAFVFVSDTYAVPEVPVWAIRLVLQSEEI